MTAAAAPRLAVAAGLGLAAVLGACAQPEAPPDRFYRMLVTPPEAAESDPLLPGTLEVERPEAEGLLAGRPIVYASDSPTEAIMEYPYDFWERAPALMVRDALAACLERAGAAERIITDDLRITAPYSVIGRLIRFERIESTPPRAVIEMRLGLRDALTDDLLIWEPYEVEQPADDDTMPATVAAFDAAMYEICRRFTADLRTLTIPSADDLAIEGLPPPAGDRAGRRRQSAM